MKEQENTLYVQMLGGFSMTWNGVRMEADPKGRDSQSVRLLEAIIHSGKKGVRRVQLENILFEEREIDDVAHAMRTAIYNTKKKLEKRGLPKVNYFENRGGEYFWTDQIPVVVDAWEFERLYNEAEEEKDPDVRLRLYLEAFEK